MYTIVNNLEVSGIFILRLISKTWDLVTSNSAYYYYPSGTLIKTLIVV